MLLLFRWILQVLILQILRVTTISVSDMSRHCHLLNLTHLFNLTHIDCLHSCNVRRCLELFMGTHLRGITQCYLTQVNVPNFNPSQAGWYLIHLPRRDGRLSWPGGWLYMEMVYLCVCKSSWLFIYTDFFAFSVACILWSHYIISITDDCTSS